MQHAAHTPVDIQRTYMQQQCRITWASNQNIYCQQLLHEFSVFADDEIVPVAIKYQPTGLLNLHLKHNDLIYLYDECISICTKNNIFWQMPTNLQALII